MRTRTLATIAIAAWSKTAVGAPAVLADTHAVAADTAPNPSASPSDCQGLPPGVSQGGTNPSMIWSFAWAKSRSFQCAPAALSLQASANGGPWKTLASAHTTGARENMSAYVQHSCLPGSWSYREPT